MKYFKYLFFSCLLFAPLWGFSQETKPPVLDGTEGEVVRAETVDSTGASTHKMQLNEFDGPLSTLRFSGGFLYEFAGFTQDEISKEQVTTENNFKVRDLRFVISGKFKTKRDISWKIGFMYDGNEKSWFMRETGVMFGLPKIKGHIFIGRTKEGYSMSKIMNGYSIWNLERMAAIDVIPILSDGIKYMGYFKKPHIFWNLGAFANWTAKEQSFATFQYHFVTRVAWLPIYTDVNKPVLHIGASYRYGKVKDGKINVKSKPEVSGSPNFVETGSFSADYNNSLGGEIYFRSGKLLLGTEYHAHKFASASAANPVFFGGEAFVAYMFTGEVKPYYSSTGIFGFIKVKKSIYNGGWGAFEGMLRFTNLELTDGNLEGGDFWRITPAFNWYPSDNFRLFVAYGYCVLDRYGKQGTSNIFQVRGMIYM